jgi:hypothetical protein
MIEEAPDDPPRDRTGAFVDVLRRITGTAQQ